jgi:hypothetical protein
MRQRVDTKAKLGTLCVLALTAIVVTGVGLAWACSPNANISVAGPNGASGRPGSPATVRGSAFAAGKVVVHWNSASGPVLATLQGESWSAAITVPNDAPGVHYVVAFGYDESGAVAGQASALFEITPPEPVSTAAADSPAAGASDVAAPAVTAPAAGAPAAGAPTAGAPTAGAPAGRGAGSVPSRGGGSATDRDRVSPTAPRKVAATSGGRKERDRARPSNAPRRAGRAAPGAAPAAVKALAGAVASRRQDGTSRSGSRGDSVTSRAIGAPKHRSARPKELPSLTSSLDSRHLDEGPDSRLGIGVAMLALGLLAPLASFLVADVRRRRARASSRHIR